MHCLPNIKLNCGVSQENIFQTFQTFIFQTHGIEKINQSKSSVFLHASDMYEHLQKWSLSSHFNPKDLKCVENKTRFPRR